MSKDCIEVKFMGLKPESEYQQIAKNILERLEEAAPANSNICLRVIKAGDSIKSICQIKGKDVHFKVLARGNSVFQALLLIEKKMKIRLNHWKQNRVFQTVNPFFEDMALQAK